MKMSWSKYRPTHYLYVLLLKHFDKLIPNVLRFYDTDLSLVVEYPRIKGGACGCICVCVEMLRILLGIIEGFNVLAKLIYDAVHHGFLTFQSYSCQLSIEHQEVRLQEGVHIESFLYWFCFLIHDFKRSHSIYAIHDLVIVFVV